MREQNTGIELDSLWKIAEGDLGLSVPCSNDDLHVKGLGCLIQAMTESAGDDKLAIRIAKREIYSRLLSYMKFERDRSLYPDIPDVPGPLFIVGFGRTGSTFLHNLLALDNNARTPRLWELWNPSPPPRFDSRADATRIEIARRRLEFVAATAPRILEIHPMDPQGPDECHWLMRHSPLLVMLYGVPAYWEWLKALTIPELCELYAVYKLQIQHLKLFWRGGRWVSKAFSHLHYLPVLFDIFPDANVVRLHRDPCQAIPSLCSLAAGYRSIFLGRVDLPAIGQALMAIFIDGMRRSMEADKDQDSNRFTDTYFTDLVADPIGVVRQIYDRFGYEYTTAFEQEMNTYIHNRAHHGIHRHAYQLEEFALSRAQVLVRSEEYLAWLTDRTGKALIQ